MEVFRSVWLFFQDQILGIKWLSAVIQNGLSALGLDTSSRLGGSIQFFIYDVKNHAAPLRPDFFHFLHSKLLPA